MSEQRQHEQAIFEAFIEWLLEDKGLMLQFVPYIDNLADDARKELKARYLESFREILDAYVDVNRGYPNQPVWCIRHHMQTCHRCFAEGCGDNSSMLVQDRALLQAIGDTVIGLCRPTHRGGFEKESHTATDHANAIEALMRRCVLKS